MFRISLFDDHAQLTREERSETVLLALERYRDDVPWWPEWIVGLLVGLTLAAAGVVKFAPIVGAKGENLIDLLIVSIAIAIYALTGHTTVKIRSFLFIGLGTVLVVAIHVAATGSAREAFIGGGFLVLSVVISRLTHRRLLRPYIRQAMLDLGFDEVCHQCGYRMATSLESSVQCQECGAVRERPRPQRIHASSQR